MPGENFANNQANTSEMTHQESGPILGPAALDAYAKYENESPIREKISHPERFLSENEKILMGRKAEEKTRDIELNERRKLKEVNKYNNSYSNSEKEAISQARANLPIIEKQLETNERIHEATQARVNLPIIENQPVINERIRKTESLDFKVEKMYNFYSEHFSKNASEWLAYGIFKAIERGTFDRLPTDTLIASGFQLREQDKIHDKLDPEDTLSAEASDAEHNLKVHVSRDLIGEKASDLSETEIKRAKLKGSLYSIYSGAKIDERSRKIVYAIPSEKGDEVRKFMEESGIDFRQFGENARARALSYQGFANIIEAIKGDKKETERGFKALDWYFDNFGYGKEENIKAFLGTLESYEEAADDAWKTKYNEYLDSRKEVEAFYEAQQKAEAIPIFERENIQEDVSVEDLREKLLTIAESGEDRILPRISIGRGGSHGGPRASFEDVTDGAEADQYAYIDAKKLGTIISKYEEYQRLDPNIKLHTVLWANKNTGKETHYAVLDYAMSGQKVAVVAPYEANSSNAAFNVIGVDWKDVFIASSESKLSVRDREGVKALNHRASMKYGRDNIQNMWFKHEKYVDKSIRDIESA